MAHTLEDLQKRDAAYSHGLSSPQARAYLRQSFFENAKASKTFRSPAEYRSVMRTTIAAIRGMIRVDKLREKPLSERGM